MARAPRPRSGAKRLQDNTLQLLSQIRFFKLGRGSLTVVTGRIGSGKTTLLRAVLGLLEPQAKGVKLSGGQIQRTAAARMFVREPELLVLDDLSSALDVETERTLWKRIFEQQATCLVASHRRAVLEKADQILVLEEGRITARGRLPELIETSAEMRRLYAGEPQDD